METWAVVLVCVTSGLNVLAAMFVAFFKGYAGKKGENLATKEDLKDVVDQVRAVTRTTEEIKQELIVDTWAKQRCWDLKRDLILEMLDVLGDIRLNFMELAEAAGCCCDSLGKNDSAAIDVFMKDYAKTRDIFFSTQQRYSRCAARGQLIFSGAVRVPLHNLEVCLKAAMLTIRLRRPDERDSMWERELSFNNYTGDVMVAINEISNHLKSDLGFE